jgi:hypothetical protein
MALFCVDGPTMPRSTGDGPLGPVMKENPAAPATPHLTTRGETAHALTWKIKGTGSNIVNCAGGETRVVRPHS